MNYIIKYLNFFDIHHFQLILFTIIGLLVFTLNAIMWQSQQNQIKTMHRQKSNGLVQIVRTVSLDQSLNLDESTDNVEVLNEEELEKPKNEQTNVHQFILTQFKEKYDKLKGQFEAKKKEADSLLYDKKKLQIELLNHNVEYYEKEIVRLREEVEKYQLQNEQNKHRYFIAENSRKDLEATSKVKQQELKQVLKQFEKEKITVVELKHQLGEKDKNFMKVIEEVEKANMDLSQKYDDCIGRLNKSDAQLKMKTIELQQTKNDLLKNVAELQKIQSGIKLQAEKYNLLEYRSKNRIQDLQDQLKEIKRKQNDQIKKLQIKVKELQEKRKSEGLLLVQKTDNAQQAKVMRAKQEEVAYLQATVRDLQFQINQKTSIIQSLQGKLKNACNIEELHHSEERFVDMLNRQKVVQRNLQNRVNELEKEIQMNKLQNRHFQQPKMKSDFQTLLKAQIQQNSKMKWQLSQKIDENYVLRNSIQQQQIKESLLQNQIQILKKKQRAEEKNSKIGFQIDMQNLKNQVDSLRRKLDMAQNKFNIKVKEVKEKDKFITNVIIGRSRQEDVPFVVAQLQRIFQAEYVNKLSEANLKISDLQSKLQLK